MEISYEDATPFVYLQELLEGRISNNVIRHIFIDEAQDYSPFQFAFIQQLFPYSKMTLLGDLIKQFFQVQLVRNCSIRFCSKGGRS